MSKNSFVVVSLINLRGSYPQHEDNNGIWSQIKNFFQEEVDVVFHHDRRPVFVGGVVVTITVSDEMTVRENLVHEIGSLIKKNLKPVDTKTGLRVNLIRASESCIV